MKVIVKTGYLISALMLIIFLPAPARAIDADVASQVSKGISEWRLMNSGDTEKKSEVKTELASESGYRTEEDITGQSQIGRMEGVLALDETRQDNNASVFLSDPNAGLAYNILTEQSNARYYNQGMWEIKNNITGAKEYLEAEKTFLSTVAIPQASRTSANVAKIVLGYELVSAPFSAYGLTKTALSGATAVSKLTHLGTDIAIDRGMGYGVGWFADSQCESKLWQPINQRIGGMNWIIDTYIPSQQNKLSDFTANRNHYRDKLISHELDAVEVIRGGRDTRGSLRAALMSTGPISDDLKYAKTAPSLSAAKIPKTSNFTAPAFTASQKTAIDKWRNSSEPFYKFAAPSMSNKLMGNNQTGLDLKKIGLPNINKISNAAGGTSSLEGRTVMWGLLRLPILKDAVRQNPQAYTTPPYSDPVLAYPLNQLRNSYDKVYFVNDIHLPNSTGGAVFHNYMENGKKIGMIVLNPNISNSYYTPGLKIAHETAEGMAKIEPYHGMPDHKNLFVRNGVPQLISDSAHGNAVRAEQQYILDKKGWDTFGVKTQERISQSLGYGPYKGPDNPAANPTIRSMQMKYDLQHQEWLQKNKLSSAMPNTTAQLGSSARSAAMTDTMNQLALKQASPLQNNPITNAAKTFPVSTASIGNVSSNQLPFKSSDLASLSQDNVSVKKIVGGGSLFNKQPIMTSLPVLSTSKIPEISKFITAPTAAISQPNINAWRNSSLSFSSFTMPNSPKIYTSYSLPSSSLSSNIFNSSMVGQKNLFNSYSFNNNWNSGMMNSYGSSFSTYNKFNALPGISAFSTPGSFSNPFSSMSNPISIPKPAAYRIPTITTTSLDIGRRR